MAIAFDKHSWVISTNFLTSGFTLPTKNVSFKSPWKPLWYTVTSTVREGNYEITLIKLKTFLWGLKIWVTIANVSILKRSDIRNTMANYFVYRSATASWKVIVIQRRWIAVSFDTSFMDSSVNLSSCYTHLAGTCCFIQYFTTKLWE